MSASTTSTAAPIIAAVHPQLPLINNSEPISITVGVFASAGTILLLYGLARAVHTYIQILKVKKELSNFNNDMSKVAKNPVHMVIRVPASPSLHPRSRSSSSPIALNLLN